MLAYSEKGTFIFILDQYVCTTIFGIMCCQCTVEPKDAEAVTVVSKNPISVKLRWSSQECPTSSSASPAKIVKNDYDLCQDAAGDMAVPVIGYTVQHRLVGMYSCIVSELLSTTVLESLDSGVA